MEPNRDQNVNVCDDVEASGAAFNYRYNAADNTLCLFRNENGCKTLKIVLPTKIAANPQLFIHHLEKATQIKALLLSNNATVRLCQTIVPDKLSAIAKSVSKLALNSFDISCNRIDKFTKMVRRSYGLKEFEIVHISHQDSGSYYKAKIVSCRNHCVIVREDTIHQLLKSLSEGILSDLVTLEFSSNNKCSEQLLRLSTRLSVMAKITNEKFLPENFIRIARDSGHATA